MKKNIPFLIVFLFFIANSTSAQETVSLNIFYEFKYLRDLAQKDSFYVSNMILSIGKNTSRFSTERQFKERVAANQARKKQQQAPAESARPITTVSGGPGVLIGRSGIAIREEIVKNHINQKLEINGFVGSKKYTVETPLPKIAWTLQPDKKLIGTDTCQKAVGSYAGRVYEVWFSPGIPVSEGPWKLSGLPGLILEAYDTSKEIFFTYKGMTRNEDNEETVSSLIKDQFSITTNLKNYNRNKQSYEQDPEAMILAEHPEARIHVINIDNSDNKRVVKIKKYNPIEKSDSF